MRDIYVPGIDTVEDWMRRAYKAEDEVERLKLMVKSITEGLDEAMETIHYLEAENDKLRKVVAFAKLFSRDISSRARLDIFLDALDDLDKEGER